MCILGILTAMVQLIIHAIIRGFIGGTILSGVTRVTRAGKCDYPECFTVSLFSHVVELLMLTVITGVTLVLGAFGIEISRTFGIEYLLGSAAPALSMTVFRLILLTIIYTQFAIKFFSTTFERAFISSFFTVVIYLFLGAIVGYLLMGSHDWCRFGIVPRWF